MNVTRRWIAAAVLASGGLSLTALAEGDRDPGLEFARTATEAMKKKLAAVKFPADVKGSDGKVHVRLRVRNESDQRLNLDDLAATIEKAASDDHFVVAARPGAPDDESLNPRFTLHFTLSNGRVARPPAAGKPAVRIARFCATF